MKQPVSVLQEKCKALFRLFNPQTKRCYKTCEQKNKVTHPTTQKCRQKCKNNKLRRVKDFRCVSQKQEKKKTGTKKVQVQAEQVQEQLIPPPLEKKLVKNFEFLDELLQKGQGIKAVDYHSSTRVSEIITMYFFKKYKQACPMYSIKTYNQFETAQTKKYFKKYAKTHTREQLKQSLLQKQKADYSEWDKDKFLNNLQLCLETGEQLIIVPVQVPEHLNMLFIKVATREVIRFEPHGDAYKGHLNNGDKSINTFLEKLTTDINNYLQLTGDKKFIYKPPSDICPRYTSKMPSGFYQGFQSMERKQKHPDINREAKGFCLLWSWFFAECVMANPTMAIKDVYKEAWEAINTNEGGFATIIRGYFLSINAELVKMNKTFSIHSDYIKENKNTNEVFLAYLNTHREQLHKKPRTKFQGGVKDKHKFIFPAVNPKVRPIQI